ncbi:uncharacterized protein LOC106642937 [Copidosoma floridanum]|uniref:uncharacterized protein LOC106642937 n=1 Tax=Copidosoma floridanum TaxID=29053 RepID=UPI0006C9C89B|nr:uncharacterized protein LOC106642937 [Copidosoma floridanum]
MAQNRERPAVSSELVEKVLSVLYATSALASLLSMLLMLIVWQHWIWTLDGCINGDCGCILYGKSTFSTFMGGDVKLCHYGSFGLVGNLLVSIVLGFYHGYRSCIPRSLSEPRALATGAAGGTGGTRVPGKRSYENRRSMECEVMVVGPKQRAPFKSWMPFCFLAIPLSALALIYAAVVTDGYSKTCAQYRRNLVRLVNPIGQELLVIHNRLNCGAIFDFMDYLHPDPINSRRGDIIDTGLLLQTSIAFAWINVLVWVTVLCLNGYMGRQRHKLRNESMCCCCC